MSNVRRRKQPVRGVPTVNTTPREFHHEEVVPRLHLDRDRNDRSVDRENGLGPNTDRWGLLLRRQRGGLGHSAFDHPVRLGSFPVQQVEGVAICRPSQMRT